MKSFFLLFGLLASLTAQADCMSGGKRFPVGGKDCNGRICGKDGVFHGKGTKMLCDYSDETPCYAYGKSFAVDEEDCDGRVCQPDGTWNGIVKSGICDYPEEDRDPSSAKPKKKRRK